jgi:hypothetical protein
MTGRGMTSTGIIGTCNCPRKGSSSWASCRRTVPTSTSRPTGGSSIELTRRGVVPGALRPPRLSSAPPRKTGPATAGARRLHQANRFERTPCHPACARHQGGSNKLMSATRAKYDFFEKVVVCAPGKPVDGKLGAILGRSQRDDGSGGYGAYIYERGTVWSLAEEELLPTGEFDVSETFYDGSSLDVAVDEAGRGVLLRYWEGEPGGEKEGS